MIKIVAKRITSFTRIASYVFLLMQWAWVLVLYFSWAIESGVLQSYLDATQTSSVPEPVQFTIPEFIRQPLAIIVLIVMTILSIVLVFRAPQKATEVTIRATAVTAKSITPVVQKVAHVPKNREKQLARSALMGVIIGLSLLAWSLTLPIIGRISLPESPSWIISSSLCAFTILVLVISMATERLAGSQARHNSRK